MKSRGCAQICLHISHLHVVTLLIPTAASINQSKQLARLDSSRQVAAAVRPTSHDGGGLVFRVKWAAAPSILCNNLAGVAPNEGEVCGVLQETHTHRMSHVKSRAVTCSDSGRCVLVPQRKGGQSLAEVETQVTRVCLLWIVLKGLKRFVAKD